MFLCCSAFNNMPSPRPMSMSIHSTENNLLAIHKQTTLSHLDCAETDT